MNERDRCREGKAELESDPSEEWLRASSLRRFDALPYQKSVDMKVTEEVLRTTVTCHVLPESVGSPFVPFEND